VTKSLYILSSWQKNRGRKKVHPREKMRKKGYTKLARQKMREKNALNLRLDIGIYFVDG
jgi:hypothetical protein